MKATVTAPYTDRFTNEIHLAGDVVELTAERARELEGLGFVEAVEEAKPAPKPRTRKPAAKKAE